MEKIRRLIFKLGRYIYFTILTIVLILSILGAIPLVKFSGVDTFKHIMSNLCFGLVFLAPCILYGLITNKFKKLSLLKDKKWFIKIPVFAIGMLLSFVIFANASDMFSNSFSDEYIVLLNQYDDETLGENDSDKTVDNDEEVVSNSEDSDNNKKELVVEAIEEVVDAVDEEAIQKEDGQEKEKNRDKLNMDKYHKAVELSQATPPQYLEALKIIETIEENTVAYLMGENLKEEILEAVYIQECETVNYDYITKMLNSGNDLKVSINVEVLEIQQFGDKTLLTACDVENYNNVYVIVYNGVTELLNGDIAVIFGEVLGGYDDEEVGDKMLDILQSGYTIMLPQTTYNIPVINAKILY